jgi:hypothetical protein
MAVDDATNDHVELNALVRTLRWAHMCPSAPGELQMSAPAETFDNVKCNVNQTRWLATLSRTTIRLLFLERRIFISPEIRY